MYRYGREQSGKIDGAEKEEANGRKDFK